MVNTMRALVLQDYSDQETISEIMGWMMRERLFISQRQTVADFNALAAFR